MNVDDADIGIRFSVNGESEIECVVTLYKEKLLRYATAILCDYQAAEDIVQEVFVTAYQKHKLFDGKNLSAWLYKITYNQCMNALKKRKIFYFENVSDSVSGNSAPTSSYVNDYEKDFSDNVLRALQKLKAKERALIYGRIIKGQSYEELSALSGKSQEAIRKRYERAKKKLARYLSNIEKIEAPKSKGGA